MLPDLESTIPVDAAALDAKALQTLRENLRTGHDPYYDFEYTYLCPSPGRYEWQWFWDSCFHAIALSRLDHDLAIAELRTLVRPQREDGFIGHLHYWGRRGVLFSALYMQSRFGDWRARRSAMIQPAFLAHAVERVFQESGDEAFLAEMLPKTQAYYDWLSRERDTGDGLIGIISPFESGLDNSPAYDEPLGLDNPGRVRWLFANRQLDLYNLFCGRNWDFATLQKHDRFIVIDPFVNTVYADGLQALARLHEAAGNEQAAGRARDAVERVTAALNKACWDDERQQYVYLWGRDRNRTTILAAGSVFPAILEDTPADRAEAVIDRHIANPEEFWTPLPMPSVAASEPAFDAYGEKMIWRGPVCMNLNWLMARGLRSRGRDDLARDIARRSRTAAFADFREFYSPLTGRGMRGTHFGWGTAAVDMRDD